METMTLFLKYKIISLQIQDILFSIIIMIIMDIFILLKFIIINSERHNIDYLNTYNFI